MENRKIDRYYPQTGRRSTLGTRGVTQAAVLNRGELVKSTASDMTRFTQHISRDDIASFYRQEPGMMDQNAINMNITFKLPSSISLIQGGEMIYGEYLAKMENCIWTIGYTRRNTSDFAICVVDSDYERAKRQLKSELIRLGHFN